MFFFVERPAVMLREIVRVLKPGGRLAIATCQRKMMRWLFLPYARAMHGYSDTEMRALLETSGFESIEITSEGRLLQMAVAHKPK